MPRESLVESFERARKSSVSAFKAFYRAGVSFVDGRIPDTVVRDTTTKKLIAVGAFAYCVDVWNPLPVGETVAITCATAATLRGAYLYRQNHGPYTAPISLFNGVPISSTSLTKE